MSDTHKPAGPSPAQELATRIYVSLLTNNVAIVDGAVKTRASVESMAKLSIKLADAFYSADAAVEAAKAPKTDYELGAGDIAQWSK